MGFPEEKETPNVYHKNWETQTHTCLIKRVDPRGGTGWKDATTTFEYILSPHWQADSHGCEFLHSQNVSHISRSNKLALDSTLNSIGAKRHCRPWQDSNLQSPVSETDALSIRPQGRSWHTSNLASCHLQRFQHLEKYKNNSIDEAICCVGRWIIDDNG